MLSVCARETTHPPKPLCQHRKKHSSVKKAPRKPFTVLVNPAPTPTLYNLQAPSITHVPFLAPVRCSLPLCSFLHYHPFCSLGSPRPFISTLGSSLAPQPVTTSLSVGRLLAPAVPLPTGVVPSACACPQLLGGTPTRRGAVPNFKFVWHSAAPKWTAHSAHHLKKGH